MDARSREASLGRSLAEIHLRPLLIVFAKAPVPGRVKTRLGLDPARTVELHSAFVRDTLALLDTFAAEADLELSIDSPIDAWGELGVTRSVQSQGDLGGRMYAALRGPLAAGRPQVVILGTDSPLLPRSHVRGLLDSAADVALGPTEDGGYYGIACRRSAPGMFAGVRWSTASTLDDTVRAVRAKGLTVERCASWFDVDRPEDLERLQHMLVHKADCARAARLLALVELH